MTDDVSKYAPPSDKLLDVLGMRLIDIQNKLCIQAMAKKSKEEYIEIRAMNGYNNKTYRLKVILTEI